MTASDDREVRDAFKQWAEEMDCHQYQIFVETAKMVELPETEEGIRENKKRNYNHH